LKITASVDASGIYENYAQVETSNEKDPDSTPGDDSTNQDDDDTASTAPVPVADLKLDKSVSSSTPNVGSNVTFTVTVTNDGPSGTTGVTVEDILPTGYTYVSDDGAGAYVPGTGIWTVGSLANGVSATLKITATVLASGDYENYAQVETSVVKDPDSTPGDDSTNQDDDDTAATTPNPIADLSLTKSVSNATPDVGTNVTFTVTVTNGGPSGATGVTVEDILPSGYTYISDDGSGAYVSGTGIWTVGSLANGASDTLEITATVLASGGYENYAQVETSNEDDLDSTPGDDSTNQDDDDTALATPVDVADLSLTKTVSNATPDVGANVTFTVTVTNGGPSAATGVTVEDVLPSGYTYVSDDGGGAYVSGTGIWTVGSLANGASDTLEITASVDATGNYENYAQVETSNEKDPDSTPGDDSTTDDDDATASTTPTPVADVSITKGDDPDPVVAGTNLTYSILVSNAGPSAASNVVVTDTLPAGVTYVSDTGGCTGTTTLTCNLGTIAAGGSTPFTITVTVDSDVPGGTVLNNAASVSSSTADRVPGNNSDDEDTLVAAEADLSVSKDDGSTTYTPGTDVVYVIVVMNLGPSDVVGAPVSDPLLDTLADSWSCVAAPGASCPAANGSGGTLGPVDIVVGSSVTYTVTVSVPSDFTGDLVNTVTVTAPDGVTDPEPANNSATDTDVIFAVADLSITKDDNPDPVVAGTNLTYTISVSNAGPSDARNVVVTDTLPPEVAFVSDTDSCTEGPTGTLTCDLGDIANDGSTSFAVTVLVDPSVPGGVTIFNTADVSADTVDPEPANNSDTEETFVLAEADLSIEKSDSPDPVVAGTNLTYTVTVSNAGPSDAQNVVVTDALPAGVILVSTSGCAEDPGGVPTCSLGAIAAGGSDSYRITVTVEATVPGGTTLTNDASVSSDTVDPVPGNNFTSEDTLVVTDADLSITKMDSLDPVVAGTNLTYTVSVTNNGPSDAQGVVVTETLPPEVTLVSTSGCAEDPNGTPTCTLLPIPVGATSTFEITVSVPSWLPDGWLLTNEALVSADTLDSNPANDVAIEETLVTAEADLSITKDDDIDPVVAGTTLTYDITVSNAGPSDAQGVQVTDSLPSGVTFVSTTGCDEDPNGAPWCTFGWLAPGGSASFTITVTVDSDVPDGTVLINEATVTSLVHDPNPSNNRATETTDVEAEADLSIEKNDFPDPVVAGATLTYDFTVINFGPSDAQNVVVTDTLPAGVAYVSDTAGCSELAGVLTCGLGSLQGGGGTAGFTITVTVDADMPDGATLTNNASVTSDTVDPVPGNNSDTEDTLVATEADLSIEKSDSTDPVVAGTNLTYTVTVSNAGPSDAQSVVVTDTLPAEVSFVSTSGCAEDANGVPTCTLGTIAAGASASYTITVSVGAEVPVGTVLTNTVTVSSDTDDPTPGNNTDDEDTTVSTSADLEIEKDDELTEVTAGTQSTYAITVTNNGPSDADEVNVTDTLPTGTTYVSDTDSCTEAPAGTLNCVLGDLAAGATLSFDVVVNVDPDVADGEVLMNLAVVTSETDDPDLTNNEDDDFTDVVAEADLSITKDDSGSVYVSGGQIVYTIVVSNAGPSDVVGAAVSDPLLDTLTNSWTCVADAGSSCPASGSDGTLGPVSLQAGDSATYTVTVTLESTQTGDLDNTVTVDEPTEVTDPTPGNNTDTETTEHASITIEKAPDIANLDSNVNVHTFTITVTNDGTVLLTDVVVTDALAPDCDADIGDLAAGASVTYECTVTVLGQIDNIAVATGLAPDETQVSDEDGATVFRVLPNATVAGLVWEDGDKDGVKDADEAVIQNAQVKLTNVDTAEVRFALTNIDGRYLFSAVVQGNHRVDLVMTSVDGDILTFPPAGFYAFFLADDGTSENNDFGVAETLPVTGMDADRIAWVGFAFLALGGLLVLVTRRRREN
jgi:uncharacterized repeat protein (TIGR01451 family)